MEETATKEQQEQNRLTFKVTYEDQTTDIIKPCSWKQLEDVEILCFEILQEAYRVNFSLGSLFKPSNKNFWENAKKLAALLPVVGKQEKGFDPERIDSMDELCRIFVSASEHRHELTGSVWGKDDTLKPSEICRIHQINFFELLLKCQDQKTQTKTTKSVKRSS